MLFFYKIMTLLGTPALWVLLRYRLFIGKEDPQRIKERRGIPSHVSPKGHLVWIHAASVGEAQSALILIEKISLLVPGTHFLVTSGTVTSANLMAKRLPDHAVHQYYPLDTPLWVNRFLDHWQPDLALLMESELWPNMIQAIKSRLIPAALVNARMSEKSYRRWRFFKPAVKKLLSTFNIILAQTNRDKELFEKLGAQNIIVTDNIKHSAVPLPAEEKDLAALQQAIQNRPVWVYASSHNGEEIMTCRIHSDLKEKYPDLLSVIVPRHPERRHDIEEQCKITGLSVMLRGANKNLPDNKTDIYIADTLGELGLFYRLCEIAVIGRSFSLDGGGGHNPIEAAQLNCAVLSGPHIQYQKQLFADMTENDAATIVHSEEELSRIVDKLLSDLKYRKQLIDNATTFATEKRNNVETVMQHLRPFIPTRQKEAA
jgi:3-deoxy-D-manno-octulosonic-acid transferase